MSDPIIQNHERMSGLELAYKYIYDHNIPLDKVDFNAAVFQKLFSVDNDRYNMHIMTEIFRKMVTATVQNDYYPTQYLIPEGKRIYIRKWPRYMPAAPFYHMDALEIHYVLKGKVMQTVNDTCFELHEGDMCLIAPEATYSLFIPDENVVMFSIITYTDIIKDILNSLVLGQDILSEFFSKILYGQDFIPFLFCDIGEDHFIRETILDMLQSQDMEGLYEDNYMRAALELLCLRLLRNHKSRIVSGNSTMKRGVRITKIIDYAESHYADISLRELAKKFHYSYNYLSAVIRKHYGHSFNEIMTEIRLNKAAILLNTTDYSISEISGMLGYTEKSYFFKLFKKKFGMTPEAYRKNIRS